MKIQINVHRIEWIVESHICLLDDYDDYEDYPSDYSNDDYGNDDAQNTDDYSYSDYESDGTEKSSAKCEDNKDCEELGIIDKDACDFAPWAIERCPLTCGVCQPEGTPKSSLFRMLKSINQINIWY